MVNARRGGDDTSICWLDHEAELDDPAGARHGQERVAA